MNLSSGAAARRTRPSWRLWPSCLVLALGLAGCTANRGEIVASTTAADHVVPRPGVSPRGAPVAIASVEGAPAQVAERFAQQTRDRAAGLEVVVTDRRDAKYFVRGYLDAQPSSDGAVVSYVLDVFDARKARVQRLSDAVTVRSGGSDPWSRVDDKVLGELAAKSAADLAATLSNMPEAVMASRAAPERASGGGAPGTGAGGIVAAAALR